MCVNYAPVNAITPDSIYPINDCLSVLTAMGGGRVFSNIDIKAGYHNIPIKKGDEVYTVFTTQDGAW